MAKHKNPEQSNASDAIVLFKTTPYVPAIREAVNSWRSGGYTVSPPPMVFLPIFLRER